MIWRIILWGSLIWLPYLMYRVLGGEAKFTKNIVVGVTMPFEGRETRRSANGSQNSKRSWA